MWLFFLILFEVSCFFAAAAFIKSTTLPYLMLWIKGVSTNGTITDLTAYDEDEWTEWLVNRVSYSFTLPNGEIILGYASVSEWSWGSLKIGQSVEVRYMPNNPQKNMLADYYPREMDSDGIGWPLLFIGMGIALLLVYIFCK